MADNLTQVTWPIWQQVAKVFLW